jgi:hypothetical protein
MSYCPIYKAASTTWLHQLLILAGRTEQSIKSTKKQLSEQARAIYPVQDSDQVEEVSFPKAFPANWLLAKASALKSARYEFLILHIHIIIPAQSGSEKGFSDSAAARMRCVCNWQHSRVVWNGLTSQNAHKINHSDSDPPFYLKHESRNIKTKN